MLLRTIKMKILLIRPLSFGFNPETAETNKFQNPDLGLSTGDIKQYAQKEFDAFVVTLGDNGIETLVYEDRTGSDLPDSVFPNNWFATLPGKKLITFPMEAKRRRQERREDIIADFQKLGYTINRELESYESQGLYLEGTGSVILDHQSKLAYAALSPRTHKKVLAHFCAIVGYTPMSFNANGPMGEAIYHTNVMMSIGSRLAIICPSIIHKADRAAVLSSLSKSFDMLEISADQVYSHFLGNCLFVSNSNGQECLVMSEQASRSLTTDQVKVLDNQSIQIVSSAIPTIEQVGGGSTRCMMAEVYA